jgi:ferredoxin
LPDDVFWIRFSCTGHPPVQLHSGARLVEHLDVPGSPLLFGCRTGICGTCLVRVEVLDGHRLDPPDEDEAELLAILCPGRPEARLACQLQLTADIDVEPVGATGCP